MDSKVPIDAAQMQEACVQALRAFIKHAGRRPNVVLTHPVTMEPLYSLMPVRGMVILPAPTFAPGEVMFLWAPTVDTETDFLG